MCQALRSFAAGTGAGSEPYVNFEEGVAETSEIYIQGYAVFMMDFGPELNGAGYAAYDFPIASEFLAATFPGADALYRLWQDQIFGGYGYGNDGALVPGAQASPTQLDPVTWSPIP